MKEIIIKPTRLVTFGEGGIDISLTKECECDTIRATSDRKAECLLCGTIYEPKAWLEKRKGLR